MTLRKTAIPRISLLMSSAVLLSLLNGRLACAEDGDCKAALAAFRKYTVTPNHTYLVRSGQTDGEMQTTESIFTGNTRYVMTQGRWIINPMDTNELLEAIDEDSRNSKCSYLHEDFVGGGAAAVYAVHRESDYLKTDTQVWVSKKTGLVIKQESVVTLPNDPRVRHESMRVIYDNVQAPAGAKTS